MTTGKNPPAADEGTKIGENILYFVDGDVLTITVDLSQRFGLSSTGKTVRIGSTGSNKEVAPSVFLGVNVYTYPEKK